MAIKKHINLNQGCSINTINKKIIFNLGTEYLLNSITQALKNHYSPETQKNAIEESSKLLPDFVLQ